MATLNLIRGYPGQGKTSFANSTFSNIVKFENDMYFYKNGEYCYDKGKMPLAIEWCLSNVENCLRNGMDVCVSNTFTKKNFVESYKKIAEKYNAEFKVFRMMGNFKNIHNVPLYVLENMKKNFEDYEGEKYVYPVEETYSISNTRIKT